MALQSSTPTHAAASAANLLQGARNLKSRLSADDDGADGFAAQLKRAQPQGAAKAPEAAKADDVDKPDAKDGKDDRDAKPADGAPDTGAQLPWAPPVPTAPAATPAMTATTALAGQAAEVAVGDAAGGPLAALRKGAARGGKDVAADALVAGRDAKAGASAPTGKGAESATDAAATVDKTGAANVASETKDSMAALLPQADPVTVQAGAIGASPNAVQDGKAAAEQAAASAPAQAALPMAPQSPAFAPALGRQIEVWMRDGVQHAEVQLSPQDLGPIRVRIAVEGAQTRVEMSADVASTRDALQQALPQLADSLGQVGLALTGGGVSDQSTAQSQAGFQSAADAGAGASSGRPGATRGGADADDGLTDFGAATAARQAAQRRGLLDMYA